MAKSGRKRKKAEKSKTKLRQSIKLPKGLNDTKTDIASKKITVLNQLKNRDELDEVAKLTKRKIGIKDLLHKTGSNGVSIKLEGIEGLGQLIKIYPELCQEYLSQLINSLFPLTSYIESRVRTATRALIHSILNKVPSQQLNPLYSIISAHLCCGLSHIDTDIQLDTLKLLDIVIESSPGLVVECHKQLLPNCLDQVSLKGKSTDSANRTLTKNLSGKITALQWRTDVLQRVYKILSLMDSKTKFNFDHIPQMGYKSYEMNYLSLNVANEDSISMTDIIKEKKLKPKKENDAFTLQNFYVGLFNILLDTWCESVALGGNHDKKQRSSGLVSSTILPTLEVIIKLMVVSQDLKCSSLNTLFGQIIKNFPYEALHQNMDKKNDNNDNATASQLNLNICYLGFQMKEQNSEIISHLLDYLSGKQWVQSADIFIHFLSKTL